MAILFSRPRRPPAALASAMLIAALTLMPDGPAGATDSAALRTALQAIADSYLAETAPGERASGISASVSLPGGEVINLAAGRLALAPDAPPVTPDTLFQIGSISKSFTAAALLQLQAEGKLDLDDTLGKWAPEYPAWKDVSLRRLLNMTSGIPGYDNAPAMAETMKAQGIGRHFTPGVLASFADPTLPGAPKPTEGYDYSNTNYILAGMVIERAGGQTVQETFETRFFGPTYGLTDSHYAEGVYPPAVTDRMASGYFVAAAMPELKAFEKDDIKLADMSWAGSAGAIVSSPAQVNLWVRALFAGNVLDEQGRSELTEVVSMKTGAPIGSVSAEDAHGFGLGVSAFTGKLGSGWTYEGESMGYRALYVYLPDKDLVATIALNSGAEGEDDHAPQVLTRMLQATLEAMAP